MTAQYFFTEQGLDVDFFKEQGPPIEDPGTRLTFVLGVVRGHLVVVGLRCLY